MSNIIKKPGIFLFVLKRLTSAGFEICPLRVYLFFLFCSLLVLVLNCVSNAFAMIGGIVFEPVLRLLDFDLFYS